MPVIQTNKQGEELVGFKQCPLKCQHESFCQIRKHINDPPGICAKVKNTGVYIHYLLDLLQNPTKFQLVLIKTQNFQLKLFNIAVTLKYVVQVTEVDMNR